MTKFARISLDFIETKPRNEGNKTLCAYPGAFEQLFCPGGGAVHFRKMLIPGGGGGGMGTAGID